MTPTTLTFSRPLYDQMLAHVLSDPTLEMCGLLAGQAGIVEQVLPVPNELRSPVAYRLAGQEFATAMLACNFEPLGIFHSHPAGPAVPSSTDVAEAAYPDSVYIIISLQHLPPSVRAFTIVGGQVDEITIRLE